jgi:hypothetical protein
VVAGGCWCWRRSASQPVPACLPPRRERIDSAADGKPQFTEPIAEMHAFSRHGPDGNGCGVLDQGEASRFRDGDPAAVGAVYQAHEGLVFAVAYKVLGDRGLAERRRSKRSSRRGVRQAIATRPRSSAHGWPFRRGNPGPGAQLSLFSSMKASATRSSPPIPARADPVPRGPPQDPGKSRGQDPLREEHRPGAPAVPGLRGQYGSRISRWNGQSRRGCPSFWAARLIATDRI